ncbi:MAG: transposase [Bacteriovoracaceae bacterium]
MPRQPLIRSEHLPYHVTQRSNNKEWFYLSLDEIWEISTEALSKAKKETGARIHAFVLMNNHYHLLISTPEANLDAFQWSFANTFTREVKRRSGRINHIFGGRYKWSLIREKNYLYQAYKYIYLNPVRAKIVEKAEDYPFSTLSTRTIEIDDPLEQEHSKSQIINWINQSFKPQQAAGLRRSLRYREFKALVDPVNRKSLSYSTP